MKIILKKTGASLKRRKELQSKISVLLDEYEDVPIFVAYKILFKDGKPFPFFDFTEGEQRKQVHIIDRCIFEIKKKKTHV